MNIASSRNLLKQAYEQMASVYSELKAKQQAEFLERRSLWRDVMGNAVCCYMNVYAGPKFNCNSKES